MTAKLKDDNLKIKVRCVDLTWIVVKLYFTCFFTILVNILTDDDETPHTACVGTTPIPDSRRSQGNLLRLRRPTARQADLRVRSVNGLYLDQLLKNFHQNRLDTKSAIVRKCRLWVTSAAGHPSDPRCRQVRHVRNIE